MRSSAGTKFACMYLCMWCSKCSAHYTLRTARPEKVTLLQERYDEKVEVFGISDLATGDYSEALKGMRIALYSPAFYNGFQGVNAVIHVASPLPLTESPEMMINVRPVKKRLFK